MKNIPVRKKEVTSLAKRMDNPFEHLHRHMDSLFDGFFRDFGGGTFPMRRIAGEPGLVTPKFEVSETDDAFVVSAELPGLDEKDIELSLEQNALILKGEKKQEREEKRKNYFYSERSYGEFNRIIPVPEGIEKDKVNAKFAKGVLTVTMPKTEKSKSERKRINISAG